MTVVYELWRQDDNGVRYLVGVFGNRGTAEQSLARLTRTPHKQTYWIAPSPPAGSVPAVCQSPDNQEAKKAFIKPNLGITEGEGK